jgi:hypothetical protein
VRRRSSNLMRRYALTCREKTAETMRARTPQQSELKGKFLNTF